jgi:hypothetical protein
MSEASEGGVPDWLRPQDYPAPQGPGAMIIWAWEFLRRNEEFRNFWQAKVEPFITAGGRIGRDQTGKRWPWYREMREKFGIGDPWSPRQNSRIPPFSDGATRYIEAPAFAYECLPDSADRAVWFRASLSGDFKQRDDFGKLSAYSLLVRDGFYSRSEVSAARSVKGDSEIG